MCIILCLELTKKKWFVTFFYRSLYKKVTKTAFSKNLIKLSNITRKYDIGLVAKLSVSRDFVTYVPDVPSYLTWLTSLRAFKSLLLTCLRFYMCLTCLHLLCALRAFIFYVLYVPSFFLNTFIIFACLHFFLYVPYVASFFYVPSFNFHVFSFLICLHVNKKKKIFKNVSKIGNT